MDEDRGGAGLVRRIVMTVVAGDDIPGMTQRQMHAMYIEAEERRRRLKSPLVPLRERRMRVGNA